MIRTDIVRRRTLNSGPGAFRSLDWAPELDFSRASSWEERGRFAALEVWPPVDVDRRRVLVEQQPGAAAASLEIDPVDRWEAARLVRLSPGLVETRLWVVFDPRLGFVPSSFSRGQAKKRGFAFDAAGRLVLPRRSGMALDFPAVVVGLPNHKNYFHWLFEAVGRYLAVRDLVPGDARLVVNRLKEPFQLEALAAAGVSREAIVELPRNRVVEFPVVYVPPRAKNHPNFSPSVIAALRSLRTPASVARRRLYISRSTRRVVNDDELGATLERHGFETVAPETLTVPEQIELFSEAEAVVGAHGAGLANTVFCPEGALLVELHPGFSKARRLLFWTLAALANLKYARVACARVDEGLNADFSVDCKHLADVLERCLPTYAQPRGAEWSG